MKAAKYLPKSKRYQQNHNVYTKYFRMHIDDGYLWTVFEVYGQMKRAKAERFPSGATKGFSFVLKRRNKPNRQLMQYEIKH